MHHAEQKSDGLRILLHRQHQAFQAASLRHHATKVREQLRAGLRISDDRIQGFQVHI